MTQLDKFLERLSPQRMIDGIASRVDNAINSFPVQNGTISTWDGFVNFAAELYWHMDRHILGIDPGMECNRDINWHKCRLLLLQEFGPEGDKTGFELARTGTGGGLYRVIKIISDRIIEKYVENASSAMVSGFIRELSVDEQFNIIDEYIQKFGHLYPLELTEGSAVRFKMNFAKILADHPRMMKRLSDTLNHGFNRT